MGVYMLISFVIVAYNAGKNILDALKSLLNQDYDKKNIEVLLVDSCSSDNTKQVMYDYKRQYEDVFNKVYILDNPKKTLPCGWNVALKHISGDIIIRIDAHAVMSEDFISNNVKLIEEGEKIVGGPCMSIIDDNNEWQNLLLMSEESMFGGGIAAFRNAGRNKYVNTLAYAAYAREVFECVGGYDERLTRTEDNEMHYRMRRAGYKFCFNTNIKSFHKARNSLKGMIRQKFLNGYWIGLTMGVCPKCFSIYHLVPFAFVLSLITTLILAAFGFPLLFLFLILLYALCNISMSVLSIIQKKKFSPIMLLLPILFFILHISYGVGTLMGIVKLMFWKQKNIPCQEIINVKNVLKEKGRCNE